MAGGLRLYTIAGSHACLVAELMLEHKKLEYGKVVLPPGIHALVVRLLRFPARTVPALRVGTERIQGTRNISRALEAFRSEPALFPRDPDRRRAVEEAERRGEEMQNGVRRIFYSAARRHPSLVSGVLGAGLPPGRAAALRLTSPLLVRAASIAHGASDRVSRRDLARLPGMLDEVDRWIEDGTLGGADLNAADFQIAASLRPLLLFDELVPLAAGRPWAAHARRVAPDYPGDTHPRSLPDFEPAPSSVGDVR
jgi:glutathione S-transferase